MDHHQLFESLGMSPNEAKIYDFLISHGESGVSEIAVGAAIHRRNAYDAINRLIEKGLCFQIFSSTENLYNAVDPEKLLEFTAEKQKELDKVLPELKKKFGERIVPEEAFIYRGLEGQKNIWRDILRLGKDVYVIGAKGGWYDPELTASRSAFLKEANRKNIKFFQLYDQEIKTERPALPKAFEGALEYRFLPKKYSTNSCINIFDDYVITYTGLSLGKSDNKLVFFVIHSKDMADSYRTWFRYMWDKSSDK